MYNIHSIRLHLRHLSRLVFQSGCVLHPTSLSVLHDGDRKKCCSNPNRFTFIFLLTVFPQFSHLFICFECDIATICLLLLLLLSATVCCAMVDSFGCDHQSEINHKNKRNAHLFFYIHAGTKSDFDFHFYIQDFYCFQYSHNYLPIFWISMHIVSRSHSPSLSFLSLFIYFYCHFLSDW